MERTVFNQILANIGINGIIRFRFIWLAIIAVIVAFCGLGIRDLRLDSSNESFLPKSDDTYLANERFKTLFGNEEFVFILVKPDNLLTTKTLDRIKALSADLEKRLPFVDEVNTITNVEYIESKDDSLLIEDMIGEQVPVSTEDMEALKSRLSSSKLYINRIVTSDWQYAGIAISLERMPESVWVKANPGFSPMDQVNWKKDQVIMSDSIYAEPQQEVAHQQFVEVVDPRKLITPALNVILKDHERDDFQLLATGMPIGDFEVDHITAEEGSRIGIIALIAAFVFMLILFRNPVGVIAPLIVMISTVLILFGLMGWLNVPVSMGSMFVAPLLMVLSVSYSIHFINHFVFYYQRKGERLRALHYAYGQSAWPCFLTAITTAIGFGSFLVVSMKPIRDVGLACGSGSIISFVLVMMIVPIFYSFEISRQKNKSTRKPSSPFPRGMVSLSQAVITYKVPVIIISITCFIFGAVFFQKIPVETDLLKLLGDQNSFVKNSKSITDVLGGYYSYEVLIELEKDDMAKSPDILKALATLSDSAQKWKSVQSTMSLVDLVQEINYVMHERNPDYNRIPDTREEIAQYLLLYEISGGGELDNWVDYHYNKLRLSVQMTDSGNLDQHIQEMQNLAKQLFPAETTINFVGDVPILLRLMNLLTFSQLESIILAFAVISLVMIINLKSFYAGILSMIPNIFPLVVIAGVMGLMQINLDIMTIMIAPMIIGIAIDDTVHFFIHFKDELAGFKDYQRANRQTFIKIGHALLFTSVVLALGFGILGFSHVNGIVHMGFLATIGVISALLADYFITPLLLVYLKPFGKYPEQRKQN